MWTTVIAVTSLIAVTLITIGSIFRPFGEIKETQIVIIGAGSSGIAAASRLLENGIDNFVILEAENRIGGRVNTIKFGEGYLDLGGQWAHGEEGNVAFEMAKEHDLLMETKAEGLREGNVFIEESGSLIEENTAGKFVKIYEEIVESAQSTLGNYAGSLGEYFEQEYPKKLEKYSLTDSHLAKLFYYWLEKAENVVDSSDSWYETSGRWFAEYKACPGKNYAWKTGYSTVLDLLMKKIPDPAKELPVMSKVNLDTEVTKIIWDNSPRHNSKKIQVECSNGLTYLADHVIVTVSLGVLKERVHSMFSPALPVKKINSIKGFHMGTVDKIYLKFPYKWWPENYIKFSFLRPDYNHTCRSKDCWMKNLFVFHIVDNHPLLLVGWIIGHEARIMEQVPIEEVKEECVKVLNKYVGNVFNISVPQPDQILRSTWYSNPHFRGSCGSRSLVSDAMGATAADLAEPVLNSEGLPILMFAGEATHSHYFSTVHGAIETGRREADRILKFYQS